MFIIWEICDIFLSEIYHRFILVYFMFKPSQNTIPIGKKHKHTLKKGSETQGGGGDQEAKVRKNPMHAPGLCKTYRE